MSNKIYYTLLMSINILLSISCTQQYVEEEHGIIFASSTTAKS